MYLFINFQKIIRINPKRINNSSISYANEEDEPKVEYKELVVEEKPNYDPEIQELYSWFEDGDVITKKFEVIDKEV